MTEHLTDTAALAPGEKKQRSLPPSMVTIAVALFGLFLTLVVGTIVTVIATDGPEPPTLEGLPLPAGVEIVDSMPTCTDSACDGQGVVLIGSAGEGVAGRVARAWRDAGWASLPCRDEGTMCFADEDLRISMSVWADVDPLRIPKLWDAVADSGIDAGRLVYVHYFRCGPIVPCE